jgi:hypothetical protein
MDEGHGQDGSAADDEETAMSDIADTMRIVKLEDELRAARTVVSRAINTLEQVKIAIEEDDTEEALRLIKEATGQ